MIDAGAQEAMMAENEATVEVQAEEAKTLKHMRVAKCSFGVDPKGNERYERHYPGAKTNRTTMYDYLTDLDLKPDDVACVETPHGFTLVTVKQVGPDLLFGDLPGHKWIIDKVDIQGHQERRKKAERRQFLLESLKQRAKEIRQMDSLTDDLKNDPASQSLLEELKTLQ